MRSRLGKQKTPQATQGLRRKSNIKSSYAGIVAWNMAASRNPPQRKESRVKWGLARPRFIVLGDYTE